MKEVKRLPRVMIKSSSQAIIRAIQPIFRGVVGRRSGSKERSRSLVKGHDSLTNMIQVGSLIRSWNWIGRKAWGLHPSGSGPKILQVILQGNSWVGQLTKNSGMQNAPFEIRPVRASMNSIDMKQFFPHVIVFFPNDQICHSCWRYSSFLLRGRQVAIDQLHVRSISGVGITGKGWHIKQRTQVSPIGPIGMGMKKDGSSIGL